MNCGSEPLENCTGPEPCSVYVSVFHESALFVASFFDNFRSFKGLKKNGIQFIVECRE